MGVKAGFALLVALSVAVVAFTAIGTDARWGTITGDLAARMAVAGTGEGIPVIITFKDNTTAAPGLMGLLGQRVRAVDSVGSVIESAGGKVKRKYDLVPGIAANVTPELIESLSSYPNVMSIVPDRKVHAFLEDSVPLIRANSTWDIVYNGLNTTGTLTSVCIIDSGVYYNHPDLGGCIGAGCKILDGYDYVNDDSDPVDDNGHGSHVAGIIAANGSVVGVSPGANLIAIKALDQDGSGSMSDIDAGIEWCVNNADTYNITAISMSLGFDCDDYPQYCYNSYCDSDFASTATRIDAATDNNITVLIATGNDYEYDAISAPACIENAVRVTATDKSDSFPATDFPNRASGFPDILTGPGVAINSTVPPEGSCTGNPTYKHCDSTRYLQLSGTSMSTPHVAAAVTLFASLYRQMNGHYPSRDFIWSRLNSTGTPIYDPETGLNFARIDAYAAVASLISSLSLTIISPGNRTYKNGSITFNVTSERALSEAIFSLNGAANATLVNKGGYWYNDTEAAIEGTNNVTFWTNDTYGNINVTTVYFTVDSTPPYWWNMTTGQSSTYSPGNRTFFNVTWTDARLESVLLEGNWSGSPANYTMRNAGNGSYRLNATLPAGSFYWLSWANDTIGNRNSSARVNFTISRASPGLALLVNGSDANISINQSAVINITTYSNASGNITIRINGSAETSTIGSRLGFTRVFSTPGHYNITASFLSNTNYTGNSKARLVIVNDTAGPSISNATITSYTRVLKGENVSIRATVTDMHLDTVLYNITASNNTAVSLASGPMGNVSSLFTANYTTNLSLGSYIVHVWANDTGGNIATQAAGTFTISKPVNLTISLSGYNGSSENVTRIRILYNGTNTIRNASGVNVSGMESRIPEGLWDVVLEESGLNVSMRNTNITNGTKSIILDRDVTVDILPSSVSRFVATVAINTTLPFSMAVLNMSFNVSGDANRLNLGAYACHSWNISARACASSWENVTGNATFYLETNVTSISTSRFSAFSVSQNVYCGDGTCNGGETCGTCPGDCGACQNNNNGDTSGTAGTTGGTTIGSASTGGSVSISSYPSSSQAKAGGSNSFIVKVVNSGDNALTGVSLNVSMNCTGCYVSVIPSNISIATGGAANFTVTLGSGSSPVGIYNVSMIVSSDQGASDSVTSVFKVVVCVDAETRCNGDWLQECSGNEWNDSVECEHGCSWGSCNPGPPIICDAGKKRCQGNIVQICSNDRTRWDNVTECGSGCFAGECTGEKELDVFFWISVVAVTVASVAIGIYYAANRKNGDSHLFKSLEKRYSAISSILLVIPFLSRSPFRTQNTPRSSLGT
ncbi:MAG: hypothetical protein DRO99_00325 [Candidatus Aenigmatarchaeota archaeon]|nr:MAG: hypothetical protein DRO99_00325 [Candidatus Aenigmarchaeota archaeon]